jgi:hypothetical protein
MLEEAKRTAEQRFAELQADEARKEQTCRCVNISLIG